MCDNSAQFDFIADSVVHLVNENRQSGEFADQVAQFIRLTIFFVITFLK